MITELQLINFRGFDRHILPLRKSTTIVGRNNAGKSTVVEALRLVSVVTNRYQSLMYHSVPDWLDRPRRERCVLPRIDEFELDGDAVFNRLTDPPARIIAKFATAETVEVAIGPRLQVIAIIRDSNGDIVRTKAEALRINLPRVGVLPQIGPLLREENVLDAAYVRRSIDSPRSSLHFRNQLYQMSSFFKRFKALAEITWPGVLIDPLEAKELTLPGGVVQRLSLFLRDQDFTAEVGWTGHGLQMWLQMIWFLTHAESVGTLVLDEPDVYMHADLQRKLVRFLKTRAHQTLIATHSVEIMSEVEPEEVLIIDRREARSGFASNRPAVQSVLQTIGSIHNLQLARLHSMGRLIMLEGEDMDILKRLQNVLFPNSSVPIDLIPHRSIGGWSGWERARGLAMLLRTDGDTSILPYCIFDADYHTNGAIQYRKKTAADEGISLHIWKRKEIENYLIVPSALRRIFVRENRREKSVRTESEIENKIEEIIDGLKSQTVSCFASEYYEEERRRGFAGANKLAFEKVEDAWTTLDAKLEIVCGKDVIHGLAEWARNESGVSLNAVKLAAELRPNEIDAEVKKVITALEERQPF
jgi:hypothetical protein